MPYNYIIFPQKVQAILMQFLLVGRISSIDSEIKELKEHRKWLREYKKAKPIFDEWQSLSGRKQKNYQENNRDEIDSYYFYKKKIFGAYPDGHILSDEALGKRIKQLAEVTAEHSAASAKSKELMQAQKDLEAYLRQYEPQVQSQEQQKKKKRNDLE